MSVPLTKAELIISFKRLHYISEYTETNQLVFNCPISEDMALNELSRPDMLALLQREIIAWSERNPYSCVFCKMSRGECASCKNSDDEHNGNIGWRTPIDYTN